MIVLASILSVLINGGAAEQSDAIVGCVRVGGPQRLKPGIGEVALLDGWTRPLAGRTGGQCTRCNYTVRDLSGDSTPADAIVGACLGVAHGLIPFVRTLRTTGCRAHVFLFVDERVTSKMSLVPAYEGLLVGCNIDVICVGAVGTAKKARLKFMRFWLFRSFLRLNAKLFERIIVTDVSDVVFQGDPFWPEFDRTAIEISLETAWEWQGLRNGLRLFADNATVDRIMSQLTANIGVLSGNASAILALLDTYFEFCEALDARAVNRLKFTPNQVIFSLMRFTTDRLAPLPIRWVQFWDTPLTTLCCTFYWDNVTWRFGDFQLSPGRYPLLVHMYDRDEDMIRSVLDACPIDVRTGDLYVRRGKKWRAKAKERLAALRSFSFSVSPSYTPR